jgi:hypothetical protein
MPRRSRRNRRRGERLRLNLPFTLQVLSNGAKTSHNAVAVDLSRQGARFRTRIRLASGEMVEVFPSVGAWKPAPGRVVWVGSPRSNMGREVGLQYMPDNPEQV